VPDDPTQPFGGNEPYIPPVQNKLVMPDAGDTGERMMKWLSYEHLPEELQGCVKSYRKLGTTICQLIPAGPERTVALRKLVESKDCAVRAIIEGKEPK
jgi:hypothetical protein